MYNADILTYCMYVCVGNISMLYGSPIVFLEKKITRVQALLKLRFVFPRDLANCKTVVSSLVLFAFMESYQLI